GLRCGGLVLPRHGKASEVDTANAGGLRSGSGGGAHGKEGGRWRRRGRRRGHTKRQEGHDRGRSLHLLLDGGGGSFALVLALQRQAHGPRGLLLLPLPLDERLLLLFVLLRLAVHNGRRLVAEDWLRSNCAG